MPSRISCTVRTPRSAGNQRVFQFLQQIRIYLLFAGENILKPVNQARSRFLNAGLQLVEQVVVPGEPNRIKFGWPSVRNLASVYQGNSPYGVGEKLHRFAVVPKTERYWGQLHRKKGRDRFLSVALLGDGAGLALDVPGYMDRRSSGVSGSFPLSFETSQRFCLGCWRPCFQRADFA